MAHQVKSEGKFELSYGTYRLIEHLIWYFFLS